MVSPLITAEVRGKHRIYLEFKDGTHGEVNIRAITKFKGVFSPLEDEEYFRRVFIDPESGTIAWPNEADIDPLTLYAQVTKQPLIFDRLVFYTSPLQMPENLKFVLQILEWMNDALKEHERSTEILELTKFLQPYFKSLKSSTKVSLTIRKDDASFEEITNARDLSLALITHLDRQPKLMGDCTKIVVQPCVLINWPQHVPIVVNPDSN
jgi:hypothetical protein